jgi:hypothetical protein
MPSAADLLTVWEQGVGVGAVQRGLLLLAALFPEYQYSELAQLRIGERDRQLFALREALFGGRVTSLAACPRCGETVEINFSLADVRVPVSDSAASTTTFVVPMAGGSLVCRVPNSADLLAIASLADREEARRQLVQRCIQAADQREESAGNPPLSATVVDAVVAQLAAADPQADVQLALTCPACDSHWSAQFDIVTFLWAEITAWAHRILREVHTLATVYGWHEADILALSAQRRQIYLQLIGA